MDTVQSYPEPRRRPLVWRLLLSALARAQSIVMDYGVDIVISGVGIAFLGLIVMVAWSVGDLGARSIVTIGAGIILYQLQEHLFEDRGLYPAAATAFMVGVLVVTMSAMLAGVPSNYLILVVLLGNLSGLGVFLAILAADQVVKILVNGLVKLLSPRRDGHR